MPKSIISFLLILAQVFHYGGDRNAITRGSHTTFIAAPQSCAFHSICNPGTFDYLADVEDIYDTEDDNDPPVAALSLHPVSGLIPAFAPANTAAYQHRSRAGSPDTPLFLLYRHFLV